MIRDLFLVSYDIRRPSRLRQALNVIKNYASGGQKSAYECFLSAPEKNDLFEKMQAIVMPEDDWMCLTLDPRATVITLGKARPPEDPEFYYFS